MGSPSSSQAISAGGFEPKQSQTNLADSPSLITLFPFTIDTAIGLTVGQTRIYHIREGTTLILN